MNIEEFLSFWVDLKASVTMCFLPGLASLPVSPKISKVSLASAHRCHGSKMTTCLATHVTFYCKLDHWPERQPATRENAVGKDTINMSIPALISG